MNKEQSILLKRILYVMITLSILLLSYQIYNYYNFRKDQNTVILTKGTETSQHLKSEVNQLLQKIEKEANRLAEELGGSQYTPAQIEASIKNSAERIPEIQGVTACYESYAVDAQTRLYCPYYDKSSGGYVYVDDTYDYTDRTNAGAEWYTKVVDEGARWVEPYYGAAAQGWYIDYGTPIYYTDGDKKGQVKGTITMSFEAGGFKKIVHELSLGKTGYGMITSSAGTYLSHPIDDYIGRRNIQDDITDNSIPQMATALSDMQSGRSGNVEYYNDDINDHTILFYDHIPSTDWGLAVVFYKQDLLGDRTSLNRRYIKIFLLVSLILLFILAIYFNKDYLDRTEIWQLSIFASILLLANIALIGYLKHNSHSRIQSNTTAPITDYTSLGSYVNQADLRRSDNTQPLIKVPTGIYLNRMEFEDSYNINVSGNIWQRYPIGIISEEDIGFELPQVSPFAEALYIEEAYREVIDNNQAEQLLIGWELRATLRFNLEYGDFPFDKRLLNIQILPKNKDANILLIPDLSSYEYTNPSKKLGLNTDIALAGNKIQESYFTFQSNNYETDFGYGDIGKYEDVSSVHYNVLIKRILLNPFVTYLIPIFVVLVMMFILLLSCGKSDERQGIIECMAAFFFVLIFSHIDLRKEVVTADLIYMEYFYFITYLMIIISTFNLITYTKQKSSIFDYNENQIYEAIYFPLFMLLILAVTLFKFY